MRLVARNSKSAAMAGLSILLFAVVSCKSHVPKRAAQPVKRNRMCKVTTDCVAYLNCGNRISAFNKKSVRADDHLLSEAQPADGEFPAEVALYSVNELLCQNITTDESNTPAYHVKCQMGLCEVIFGD